MKTLLLLLAAPLFVGCIGLENRLREAQVDYEIMLDEKIEEYNEGAITEEELDAAAAELVANRDSQMHEALVDQKEAIISAPREVIGMLTGNAWIDLLLGAAGIAEGARRYTNWDRDKGRLRRGEPTGRPLSAP